MRIRLPLKGRLTLAFAAGMLLVLAGLGTFLSTRLGHDLLSGVDLQLRARAGVIVAALDRTGTASIDPGQKLIDPDEAFAQILDQSGRIIEATTAVRDTPMLTPERARALREPLFVVGRVEGVDDPARLLAVRSNNGNIVVVGAPLGDRSEALARLRLLYAIGGPAALLLSSLAGWLLAGAALRPVGRITREAAAISALEPDRRLPVPNTGDELAHMAKTLNSLLERLQESIERERRFVDEASHELRTPLMVLKTELDLGFTRQRTVDELESTVRAAAIETDRLIRLAEDLLVLARTRKGSLPLQRTSFSLKHLLEQAATSMQRGSPGTQIDVKAFDEEVRLDHVRIRQATMNLLDNALRHGSGPIGLSAERSDGVVRIVVDDRGAGFDARIADHAFEPFARGPGAAGGAGLGLAIVKAVAEAHGGSVAASNAPNGGARVVLTLPV